MNFNEHCGPAKGAKIKRYTRRMLRLLPHHQRKHGAKGGR